LQTQTNGPFGADPLDVLTYTPAATHVHAAANVTHHSGSVGTYTTSTAT
jgi:hypothetical protein